MISRAAKSVVQSFNRRRYHASKTHFKNISGNIENTNYNPTKVLQKNEKAEPGVKEATLPFKNLKFQNLVNDGHGDKKLSNAEGVPTGGKFSEVDISQAVDRRTALKRIFATGALAPLGGAALKLLASLPHEQYLRAALNTARAQLNLERHRRLTAKISKDKVEELKARIKDVLERIRKKLEELQQQRAKQAAEGKKEQSAKKEPEKPAPAAKEEKAGNAGEPKPAEKETGKKEAKDAITMAGSPTAKSAAKANLPEGDGGFVLADRRLEYYSIVIVPGLPPKLSNKQQLSGVPDRRYDLKRFTYFD